MTGGESAATVVIVVVDLRGQRFAQWPGLWQRKQSPVGMANQGSDRRMQIALVVPDKLIVSLSIWSGSQ